jgi:hypothetical protein
VLFVFFFKFMSSELTTMPVCRRECERECEVFCDHRMSEGVARVLVTTMLRCGWRL